VDITITNTERNGPIVTIDNHTIRPDDSASALEALAYRLECGQEIDPTTLRNAAHGFRMCARAIEKLSKPDAQFGIFLRELRMAELVLRNGMWCFSYTDEFRAQSAVRPLFSFPDATRVYSSKAPTAWPFFANRIPPVKRPDIRKILHTEDIDETDTVALLTRFGQRSITNPYTMVREV
jgi:hypothetical protein